MIQVNAVSSPKVRQSVAKRIEGSRGKINVDLVTSPRLRFGYCELHQLTFCVYQSCGDPLEIQECDDTMLVAAEMYAERSIGVRSSTEFWRVKACERNLSVETVNEVQHYLELLENL